jgi:hypothetical protein
MPSRPRSTPSCARKSLLQRDRRSCSSAELCSRWFKQKSFGLSLNCSGALSRPFASRRPLRSSFRRQARRVLFINSANIEAAVAVLELETLSRPAYLWALRKLQMLEIASMEEILWLRARIVLCTPCIFKRCRPNCLLARPCAVSTTRSARLLTRR